MMKPENREQMVRGYVVVAGRSCNIVIKDNPECITAYTHWYRHDDDLKTLEREMNELQRLYMSFQKTVTMTIGYEYKEYKR